MGLTYQDPLMTTITPTTPINLTKTAISLQSQEYKLGDSIYSQMDGMEMIYIPEGEFIMGADPNQGYQICLKDLENCALVNYYIEQPIHSVFLGSFWIDKSEITNEMFAEFLNTQGNQSEQGVSWYNTESNYAQIKYENGKWKPESNKGDFPVGDVTWYAAKAYCEWVGRRLPSEAEWEKAARGDDERIYPWGNLDPSLDLANYSHQSYGLTPVGSFSPQGDSPYGVQDMAGNSLEWVNDWFSYGYYEDSPKNNPQGPTFGSEKVLRGGMTGYEDVFIRTTARYWRDPNSSIIINGFRCAKSASD